MLFMQNQARQLATIMPVHRIPYLRWIPVHMDEGGNTDKFV